jgi:hypothetical protein
MIATTKRHCPPPNEHDWRFDAVRKECPVRAARLEGADPPDALITALDLALNKALDTGEVIIGFECKLSDPSAIRVVFQFQVSEALYDWFYNARTGYRSRYWMSPEEGQKFNSRLICRLRRTIDHCLPPVELLKGYTVRFVKSHPQDFRISDGWTHWERSKALASLCLYYSKVWICEDFLKEKGRARKLDLCCGLPLHVRGWDSPLATCPSGGDAWLDLKGAFVHQDGTLSQEKLPDERADAIHTTGFS